MANYTEDQINEIVSNTSILDYFVYLENKGKLKYDGKQGSDLVFRNDDQKFLVSNNGYYNFASREGGQLIKAVMEFEKKDWKESIEFLAKFSNTATDLVVDRKSNISSRLPTKILFSGIPNNEKLLNYFKERGIDNDVIKENTKQIHFENASGKYFGIGIENVSGGIEIRNSLSKTKIGKSDITLRPGSKSEMIVFEGMTDMFSFLQLQKLNGNLNNRTLVSLNSVSNVESFLEKVKDYEGKIFLCLDGDKAGNDATLKIMSNLTQPTKDVRQFYSITEKNNSDLNVYLQKKLNIYSPVLDVSTNQKISQNETTEIKSTEFSNTQQLEARHIESKIGELGPGIKSEQENINGERPSLVSDNVRNGLTGSERSDMGDIGRGTGGSDTTQQTNVTESEIEQDTLVRIVSGRPLSDEINNSSINELLNSISNNKKVSNSDIEKLVSKVTFIDSDNKVQLFSNINISDEIKDIVSQYKSGGIAKVGRGILDEYYTDEKIVDSIRNLIKDNFNGKKEISVLEPSSGTGNFFYATKNLVPNSKITAFEINETTAKISKILHPDAEINLRSFETNFIDDKGFKKEFAKDYDLVVGNPPYGEHRGLYKGLGEESKISKYEDYFVKRSIDVMKEGGTLAMVLPSTWIDRQRKIDNVEISKAYRLPSGAFKGTQVGTDIVILKKNSLNKKQDISDYFENNTENILGVVKEKSNRFGRTEQYVSGDIQDALARIERLQRKNNIERVGNLFEDLFLENEVVVDKGKSNDLTQTTKNVSEVLQKLHTRRFKSPSIVKEIDKYEKLSSKLSTNPNEFSSDSLKEINSKSDKFLSKKDKNSEYLIQFKPEIKKGTLKYHFLKNDDVVDTSLQNRTDISKEEIEAFRDTSYDGKLNNPEKHSKFANYSDGKWIHDFYYKEGNIYSKLEQLEIDFRKPNTVLTGEQYEKQKTLLKNVVPPAKTLDQIFISPNHEFVHQFSLGQIEKEQYNYASKRQEIVTVDYNLAENFKDFVRKLPSEAFAGSSGWEVNSFVDNETVTGSDKERNALVRERRKAIANDLFKKFIHEELTDEIRNKFVTQFNRNYNNIHVPNYSKFPLFSKIYKNFKGEEFNLTEVQKAGIGRQTTKGVGLLAHEVGFGKTLSGILSMHEAMERDNSKRPLIVVPNDTILKQWVETVFEVIPDAKINVLGNLGKDYDLSKFQNKDGEISIVTYEGFNNIGFSNDITENLASKFSYISQNELKSVNNSERDKQVELQKESEIVGKMKRGKVYDWEDFKFDHLTFDEVHNANHIVGKVKIEDRRFSSDFRSQNQQTSKIGINTWMAAQYIQEQHDGRNVTLLSATPFTNKPLEYYSILSLIANKRLEESGYFNVNTFFETFMEADNEMEIDAKGEVKFKDNVRRFKNNSLFQQLLSEFIDIKGEEDNPELVRPNKLNKEYKIEQNELTKEQYDILNENFSQDQKGAILTHILNARLIAISPYLSPYYEGEEPTVKEFIENSTKLNQTMDLIRQNKKDIPETGQIIYSELAVSQFPKIKEYLINEVGYKPEEVGIITGATSKPNRLKIQDEFNSGKIKVVIGSEAIQEGMNLQTNTSDIFLLSLPYNFTSLRQVEGRAWRQGNKNENVRINFMLTNDSIDVFMLQKLQAKQARYLEAMKKGADILDISDISTQELKTSIITNPETRANIEIELLKKRIESDKSKLLADSAFVLRKHQDFLKIRELVTKAEENYNRILGYSQNGDDNADWWKTQLPSYQNTIDLHKQQVVEAIEKLREKGINVTEIEYQTKNNEKKITELDEKIENLPELKEKMVSVYKLEKEQSLKQNKNIDILQERQLENNTLFSNKERVQVIEEKQQETRSFKRR